MVLSEQEKHPKRKTSSLRNLGINHSANLFLEQIILKQINVLEEGKKVISWQDV
jgi:hypothetical protein